MGRIGTFSILGIPFMNLLHAFINVSQLNFTIFFFLSFIIYSRALCFGWAWWYITITIKKLFCKITKDEVVIDSPFLSKITHLNKVSLILNHLFDCEQAFRWSLHHFHQYLYCCHSIYLHFQILLVKIAFWKKIMGDNHTMLLIED